MVVVRLAEGSTIFSGDHLPRPNGQRLLRHNTSDMALTLMTYRVSFSTEMICSTLCRYRVMHLLLWPLTGQSSCLGNGVFSGEKVSIPKCGWSGLKISISQPDPIVIQKLAQPIQSTPIPDLHDTVAQIVQKAALRHFPPEAISHSSDPAS